MNVVLPPPQGVEFYLQWWGDKVGEIWLHASKLGQVRPGGCDRDFKYGNTDSTY